MECQVEKREDGFINFVRVDIHYLKNPSAIEPIRL
jgi:hypothetical protein